MSKIMMALGTYRFSLGTAAYQTLKRSDAWRWASQDRLTRPPALQYLGKGRSSITLDGVIHPHFRGGLGQIEAMRAEAGGGKPLLLTDGLGKIWGSWVIEELSENGTDFTAEGVALKIDFSVTLAAYGEDGQ